MGEELSERDKAALDFIFNPGINPLAASERARTEAPVIVEEETEQVLAAKKLEVEGVVAAEKGELVQALEIFSRAIDTAPGRPSGYNNRANVYRMQGDSQKAFADLDKAIELGNTDGQTLSKALTTRGFMLKEANRVEEARRDFELAMKLGNKIAASEATALNPYAALCSDMLGQVFAQLGAAPPGQGDCNKRAKTGES